MKPRSSSATGSSFLFLMASMASRIQTVAPIGRGRGLLVNRQAFGEPAWNAAIGGLQHENVAHFVPHRAGPMEAAGGTSGGAVHRDHMSERYAESAQAGHAHCANSEIFVIGINLHLHRSIQLHLVLLLVGSDGALHLRFKIWTQQLCLFLLQTQDRVVGLVGIEVRSTCPAGAGN